MSLNLYYNIVEKNRAIDVKAKKYPKIPHYGNLDRSPRKILTGMYGNVLEVARKEGIV